MIPITGLLARESQFVFTCRPDERGAYRGAWLSLRMNPDQALVYQSNAMFPVLDMNLPEGYLYEQIRARFPQAAHHRDASAAGRRHQQPGAAS